MTGPEVVVTTTIWGDVVGQIATCARSGEVRTLMPVGVDPHDFAASSADVADLVRADLVVANGLGLEEGLAPALASAKEDGAKVFEVAPLLNPHPMGSASADAGHAGDDPHVWLDAERVSRGAQLIGSELGRLTGNDRFTECGGQVANEMAKLHREVVAELAAVPAKRRVLVTDHDALGYFARAYGFEVLGTVIPGGSTLAKPSSADLAQLTEAIKTSGVPAIFANTANPQALVEALAADAGQVEVVDLYVDSLGAPDSGAADYQGLMRTNAARIAKALGGDG